jgi:hypothetical protein|tara:strand:+ start:720 stop:983 length:264 start_codon:yes stop_codon:yes gene_type:complete
MFVSAIDNIWIAWARDIVRIIIGAAISGGCASNPNQPAEPSEGSIEKIITKSAIKDDITDRNNKYVKIIISNKNPGYILEASASATD